MVLDEALVIARLIADGDISPELLQGLGDAAMLQEAVGTHYDLEEITGGKKADRGKMKLVKNAIHGASNDRNTINSILMAADAELRGPVVTERPVTAHSEALRMAGEQILAPTSASSLAGLVTR